MALGSGCFNLLPVGLVFAFVRHPVLWQNVVEHNHLLTSHRREKRSQAHLMAPKPLTGPPLRVPLTLNSASRGDQAINTQALGEHSKVQTVTIIHCRVPFCTLLLQKEHSRNLDLKKKHVPEYNHYLLCTQGRQIGLR